MDNTDVHLNNAEGGWEAKLSFNKLAKLLEGKPSQLSRLLLEGSKEKAEQEKKKSACRRKEDWTTFAHDAPKNGAKAAHKYMNNLGVTGDTLCDEELPVGGTGALQALLKQWLGKKREPRRKGCDQSTWDVGADTLRWLA